VGKLDDVQYAEEQGEAHRHQGVDEAQHQAVDHVLGDKGKVHET
jgi:hypothetical protein